MTVIELLLCSFACFADVQVNSDMKPKVLALRSAAVSIAQDRLKAETDLTVGNFWGRHVGQQLQQFSAQNNVTLLAAAAPTNQADCDSAISQTGTASCLH